MPACNDAGMADALLLLACALQRRFDCPRAAPVRAWGLAGGHTGDGTGLGLGPFRQIAQIACDVTTAWARCCLLERFPGFAGLVDLDIHTLCWRSLFLKEGFFRGGIGF